MSDSVNVLGIVHDRVGRAVAEATVVVVQGTSPVPEMALVCDAFGHFFYNCQAVALRWKREVMARLEDTRRSMSQGHALRR